MKSFEISLSYVVVFSLLACAFAPLRAEPVPNLSSVIAKALKNNCKGAVEEVNAGIRARNSKMILLAGTMMEDGVCMKSDWERAAVLYQDAYEMGEPKGLALLVAVFSLSGRDPGAAMWWASRRPGALPPACVLTTDPKVTPDEFIARLRGWSPEKMAACVYTAGVYFKIASETEFASLGRAVTHSRKAHMVFNPSAASVEWQTADDGVVVRSEVSKTSKPPEYWHIRDSVRVYVKRLGDQALAKYKQPPGIDPGWTVQATYEFESAQ